MALEVIDQLSLPGEPGKANEDAVGHDAGAAVVLDGATPLGDPLMPGSSDAAWIATFGMRRLLAHLQGAEGARKALRGALADTQKSFNALRRGPLEDVWQTPAASMMLAVPGEGEMEFLWFGDCAALLKQADAPTALIGETLDRKAGESLAAAKAAKASNQPATDRQHHLEGLRARRNRINSGAYWLFTPDVRAAAHASRRVVNVQPGAHLLLCSDGFLALASDYGAYGADSLIQACLDKGLAALGDELRAIEDADAQGVKFPRFKKSDDATALLLKFS